MSPARRKVPLWRQPPRDSPVPMRWDDAERSCRRCKQPTHWRTQRGAAIHPACEQTPWDRLTPEAEREVIRKIFTTFRPAVLRIPPSEPAGANRVLEPIPVRTGPCSWCRRPGVGITDDRYLHCPAHMWPPYRWPAPKETP